MEFEPIIVRLQADVLSLQVVKMFSSDVLLGAFARKIRKCSIPTVMLSLKINKVGKFNKPQAPASYLPLILECLQ